MKCNNNDVMSVKIFYTPDTTEAVLSPTYVVATKIDYFGSWIQTSMSRRVRAY